MDPLANNDFGKPGPLTFHISYKHTLTQIITQTHTHRESIRINILTPLKKRTRATVQKTVEFFRVLPIYTNDTRKRESAKESERAIERARDSERKKDRKPCVHLLLVRFVPFKTKTKGQPSAPAHDLLLSTVESMWTKKGCVLRYGQIYVSKLYKNMNQLNVNSIGVCGKHDRPN